MMYKEQPLYWFFGKKPNLRSSDRDGLSVWKTTSASEVSSLKEVRVRKMARRPGDFHSYFTEGQLLESGLTFLETEGEGPLAEAGLKHYTLRPADAPDISQPLTPEQMDALKAKLNSMQPTNTTLKQIKFEGEEYYAKAAIPAACLPREHHHSTAPAGRPS